MLGIYSESTRSQQLKNQAKKNFIFQGWGFVGGGGGSGILSS